MGTRSGDLDPGVLLYLLRDAGPGAGGGRARSSTGRPGCSASRGSARDMRDLLAREARGSAGGRRDRALLLPGQEASRRPGRRARRAGHARLHRRHRRARGAGPRAHLRRSRVPRDRASIRRATRRTAPIISGGRQPPSRFGSCRPTRTPVIAGHTVTRVAAARRSTMCPSLIPPFPARSRPTARPRPPLGAQEAAGHGAALGRAAGADAALLAGGQLPDVGQIYLQDNPLLREPLAAGAHQAAAARPLGHLAGAEPRSTST